MREVQYIASGFAVVNNTLIAFVNPPVSNNVIKFVCELCNAEFKDSSSLNTHKLTHNRISKWICGICHKDFASNNDLNSHILIHTVKKGQSAENQLIDKETEKKKFITNDDVYHEVFTSNIDLNSDALIHTVNKEQSAENQLINNETENKCFITEDIKPAIETLNMHNGTNGYFCDACQLPFASNDDLSHHLKYSLIHTLKKENHDFACDNDKNETSSANVSTSNVSDRQNLETKRFICEICQKELLSHWALKRHALTHTDVRDFACDICDKRFRTKSDVRRHKECHPVENDEKCKCMKCKRTFPDESELSKHSCSAFMKVFTCKVCHKEFQTNWSLKRHSFCHSDVRQFVCEICNASFHRKSNLIKHKYNHLEENELKDSEKYKFMSKGKETVPNESQSQTQSSVADELFVCNVCQKSFGEKEKLARHTLLHNGEKNFSCGVCHAVFAQKRSLDRHSRIHSCGKNVSCNFCQKVFENEEGLAKHVLTHYEGKKRNFCEICKRTFDNLRRHMRTHTGEKPHVCEICQQGFALKGTLIIHLRRHTGEKPYSCECCSKTFASRNLLRSHLRSHTGEKPYECDICFRRFAHNSKLHCHRRTHTGEKPYVCKVCCKAFPIKKNLDRHFLRHKRIMPMSDDETNAWVSALEDGIKIEKIDVNDLDVKKILEL